MNGGKWVAEVLEKRVLLASGDLDPTFGDGGMIVPDAVAEKGAYRATALTADGKLLAAQSSFNGFVLKRFTTAGKLDSSFGMQGVVQLDVDASNLADVEAALAMGKDGKILFATGGSVFRLTSSGQLDGSFDGDGRADVNFGAGELHFRSLAIQGDGKIVVAGDFKLQFAVARLLNNGTLDKSFNGNGKVINNLPGNAEHVNAVAIQSDGKIVVAGDTKNHANHKQFTVARYTSSGQFDPSFGGGDGIYIYATYRVSQAHSIALLSGGKLLVGANNSQSGATKHLLALRLNSNGTRDSSYDSDGVAEITLPPTRHFKAEAMRLAPDGRHYLVGGDAVVRLTSSGAVDTSFGSSDTHLASFSIYKHGTSMRSLQVQSDGRILVAGSTTLEFVTTLPAIARLTSQGALDTSYATAGKLAQDLTGIVGRITALRAAQNGKVIAVGHTTSLATGSDVFFATRYLANGTLDTGYGSGGRTVVDVGLLNSFHSDVQMVVQNDGGIALIGKAMETTANPYDTRIQIALARLSSSGKLDASFGNNGKAFYRTGLGSFDFELAGTAALNDGSILIAVNLLSDGRLVRFDPDGKNVSVDVTLKNQPVHAMTRVPGFANQTFIALSKETGGITLRRIDENAAIDPAYESDPLPFFPRTIYAAPDGSVFIGGQDSVGFAAAARLMPNGKIDSSFGNAGIIPIGSAGGMQGSFVTSIARQSDGRLLFIGTRRNQGATQSYVSWFLFRCDATGQPDNTFGINGYAEPQFAEPPGDTDPDTQPLTATIDASGNLLAAGFRDFGFPVIQSIDTPIVSRYEL